MSNKLSDETLKALQAEGIHPVDPGADVPANAVRVDIGGGDEVDDDDLAKLLEDTAKFIRSMKAGAGPFEHREYVFKREGLASMVVMSHRS